MYIKYCFITLCVVLYTLQYRLYLQDLADELEVKRNNQSGLYAFRRGLQLRAYVQSIRTDLHETRAAEKRERQNKFIAE